ncbi:MULTISPECIES: hypothetical protein [Bacteria]|uniref:hypothetical protein n=1 Tax=Bacteria TaxID=2 RepID=UPI003C7C9928
MVKTLPTWVRVLGWTVSAVVAVGHVAAGDVLEAVHPLIVWRFVEVSFELIRTQEALQLARQDTLRVHLIAEALDRGLLITPNRR